MSDKQLALIAALLRKAEGTNNEHEADAFLTRAQTLATRHSIDLAVARAHTAKQEAREQVEERAIRIGEKGKHGLAKYVRLFLNIAEVNDIKCLISHDSTTVYAMGFPSDIELAQTLYASLLVQMVQAGDAYIKSGEYKKETIVVPGRFRYTGRRDAWGWREEEWVDAQVKPVDGRVARRSFYDGFTARVTQRLRDARNEAVAAAEAEAAPSSVTDEHSGKALSSTALVLREKKAEVDLFYAEKAKRARGSWKGGRGSAGSSSSARNAGDRAGRSARLSGQGALPSGRGKVGA